MDRKPFSYMDSENRLDSQGSQPLIRTKLFAPLPRCRLVPRLRLITQLQQSALYPLTLVCAPAGYGKTTLLAEWVAEFPAVSSQDRIPVAWLSLDGEDNDPTRFLAYLLAALENVLPGIGSDVQALLHAPQPLPINTTLAVFINSLQELGLPLWLVMDDYQFIENPTIHEGMIFLLEHMPASLHLLIATRSDPPLPLYRLRASNQLLELRAEDLRFTEEEAAAFLKQVMGLSLSREDITTLKSRTEGWIAGLQMAALAMQGLTPQGLADHSTFVREFGGSHRYILEYLIEEILNRQPANIQAFLLQTSILDRLCPSLCHAVLPEPHNSRATIDYLERSNLFLTALDEVRCWYRYHHLFADLLRARLEQLQPDLVPALHNRASIWFEQEGLPEEAVKHALAANDPERAACLVERYTLEILNRGEMSALLGQIQALPEDLVLHHPGLCIQHAWALTFSGQLGKAETRLKQAEAQIQPGDPSSSAREILGCAAIIRGLIADICGDLTTAVQLAHEADELIPQENVQGRSVVPYVLGDGYFAAGDLARAEQAYEKIHQIGRISGNFWTSEVALYKLSLVKKLQGKLRAAWELYQETIQLATEKRILRSGSMGAAYTGMSELQREWNELEAARQTASLAIKIMEHWPNPIDLTNAYLSLARVAIAQGDLPAALEAVHAAEAICQRAKIFPATRASLEACQLRLWLANADLSSVERWVSSHRLEDTGIDPDRKLDPVAGREGLTLARGLIALGRDGAGRAIERLKPLVDASRAAGQTGTLSEALALLASAYQVYGDVSAAVKTARECLILTQEEGYIRIFLDEGERMCGLLEELRLQIIETSKGGDCGLLPYLSRILTAFPPVSQPPAQLDKGGIAVPDLGEPEHQPARNRLIEPLSERELEVLALICQGDSNQEIAEKLVVTLNTVKKHNNRIFGKLGVTSRVQAVIEARRLGLVKETGNTPEE